MTNINIINPETKESVYVEVKGLYAPKRLQFLTEHSPKYVYDMYINGELQKYTEDFEESTGNAIMNLFIRIRNNNDDYNKAQALGDIELAERLANNDMERAKQVMMRERVYVL